MGKRLGLVKRLVRRIRRRLELVLLAPIVFIACQHYAPLKFAGRQMRHAGFGLVTSFDINDRPRHVDLLGKYFGGLALWHFIALTCWLCYIATMGSWGSMLACRRPSSLACIDVPAALFFRPDDFLRFLNVSQALHQRRGTPCRI